MNAKFVMVNDINTNKLNMQEEIEKLEYLIFEQTILNVDKISFLLC